MPIVTLEQVKALKGISDNTYDTQISTLIPIIQSQIVAITRNKFKLDEPAYTAETIAFVDNDPSADTITDSESEFVTQDFEGITDLCVEDSVKNDGIYHVDTVVAGTITLQTTESLINESAGNEVVLTWVKFPDDLKQVASDMIWFKIQRQSGVGVKSESLGDYSYTLETGSGSGGFAGYPAEIIAGLRPYILVSYS